MTANAEIPVTLSRELLGHLRARAAELGIPLRWLVAALVCDTVEDLAARHLTARADDRLDRPRPDSDRRARPAGVRRAAVPA